MGDVHILNMVTRMDIPVDRVIDSIPRDMAEIVVVGYTADGEFYFATNKANGPDVLWMLQMAAKKILEIGQ